MPAKKKTAEQGLTYKGKPMVRSGNTIYYGDMADDHIAILQLSDMQSFEDMKLPGKVSIQLFSQDESLPMNERFKKRADKNNLYEAIEIASIWLERA